MATILIVDDEPSVLTAFKDLLEHTENQVVTAASGEAAISLCHEAPPDVVVTDVSLPGISGLELFQQLRALRPRLPVIVMTGRGTMATAIEAMRIGAMDYLLKPFDPDEMLKLIERAVDTAELMAGPVDLAETDDDNPRDALIGKSQAMQQVFKAIGRVAMTDATVLIRGESGTGKELVARALYQHGRRNRERLLALNCAALSESLLDSELFGHERGAFTGADSRRIGKLEQAHGGTLFLDEIGDISPAVQVKLLRALQERTLERVGGNETITVDVRILAATNRDLETAMQKGKFREDLFHRLNVVQIYLPPLRERPEDVPALIKYFSRRHAAQLGASGVHWQPEAVATLQRHSWPGNVRELSNCVYRLLVFARGSAITSSDVESALLAAQGAAKSEAASDLGELAAALRRYFETQQGKSLYDSSLNLVEESLFGWALEKCGGNRSRAAELIGLPRPTFHAKLRKHGIIRRDPN